MSDRTSGDHRPTVRSLNPSRGPKSLGIWLLMTPSVEIVTIPSAFRTRCAPKVSLRLRYSTPDGASQNSLIRLAEAFLDLDGGRSGRPMTAGKDARHPRLRPLVS